MRIGTASWSIPRDVADSFPGDGPQLARYARVLDCVEINSSFYRSHRAQTWARWAATTPADFRFSAKLPRAITHDARLVDAQEPLQRFVGEAGALGEKLAVVLVQLPPSLPFDEALVGRFFAQLRTAYEGAIVCEPRHATWFTDAADQALAEWHVARAAVDPARPEAAAQPGGWRGRGAVRYYRWHGSPRVYWSRYARDWLRERHEEIVQAAGKADVWCVFDNTASGEAAANALEFQAMQRHGA
jgi:uncharacterized protein YecE (DUF72 family)